MDTHGNWARFIRHATEQLTNLADEYDESGQLEERDEVNEVAEAFGRLRRLAEPGGEQD